MSRRLRTTPDVSIVVPAYNMSGTLPRALDSVLAQTYPLGNIEVIVVDDCSVDETGTIAREYAQRFPDVIVCAATETQSGSPAEPRNVGLALARGKYVFFLDADDWLGEEAVERMLGHARAWRSDMLLVKLVGEGGREAPKSMFKESARRVNVYKSQVFWTFGPYKLYKRSLVENLRFPACMPEDIGFVLRAYVMARKVSVAADYDYYHLAYVGDDQAHASLTTWDDVDSNLEAYEDIFGYIGAHVRVRNQNGALLRRLFVRDICNTLETIACEPDVRKAQDQLLRLMQIAGPYYRPEHLQSLPAPKQALLQAAFLDFV